MLTQVIGWVDDSLVLSIRRPQFGLGEDVQGKRGWSDLHSQPHFSGALFSTNDPGNVSGNTAELVQTAFAIRSVFDRQHLKREGQAFL